MFWHARHVRIPIATSLTATVARFSSSRPARAAAGTRIASTWWLPLHATARRLNRPCSAGLCSSRSSAGGGVSSQWPCTIQLRRLLIQLWILLRVRSRWRRPLTYGYGICRPSAPYRLPAHDWTCDRAIIALEHDLLFSSAYIFLFFLDLKEWFAKNICRYNMIY